jgi:DNA-directed RNA polymerase subunit RPC12/RpoP
MKCIKCKQEDSRINGENKVFCQDCLDQILSQPIEPFNANDLNWD